MTKLLSISDFGKQYGPSRSRIYEMLSEGELRAVKVGRRTYIPEESAEAWKRNLPAFQPGRANLSTAA